ncbi:hypothetical protein HYT24_01735 [Candidatus Pacearchaeota archaeon]|nr:hypothetical protein [Candidatus Pacearchaeota archaeon]
MNLKNNKKADIPITILVIGIVAICILTISSFWYAKNQQEKDFLGIGLIETMIAVSEETYFYDDTDFDGEYSTIFSSKSFSDVDKLGYIDIIIGDNQLEGTYSQRTQNVFMGCNKEEFKFFESCPKEVVKVTYLKS